jgi:hypothetical protein
MMDILTLTSLIVSSITAVGVVIHQIHLKNCSCLCFKSNCSKTPNNSTSTI